MHKFKITGKAKEYIDKKKKKDITVYMMTQHSGGG